MNGSLDKTSRDNADADRDEAPSLTDREREILDMAIRLFAKNGFAQTDVQQIADAVGVGKGTIYRHFESKVGLFLAAARYARGRAMSEVDAAASEGSDCLDYWRRGMRAFLEFFDANPDVVELLIEERALTKGQRATTFFERKGKRSDRWRETFQQLIDAGHMRDMPVRHIEQAISRHLFGTLFVHYFAGRPEPLSEQFDSVFDILMHGLGRKDPPPSQDV